MQIKSQEQVLLEPDWFTGDSDECAGTEEWKFWFGYFNGLDGRWWLIRNMAIYILGE